MYRYKLYVYTIEEEKKNYRRVESTEHHTVSLPVVAYNGSHTDKRENTMGIIILMLRVLFDIITPTPNWYMACTRYTLTYLIRAQFKATKKSKTKIK